MKILSMLLILLIVLLPVQSALAEREINLNYGMDFQHFFTTAIESGSECTSLAPTNENLYSDPKYSAAQFACYLVKCGHFEFYDTNECQMFRDLSHHSDFAEDFQEIKNYLALIELEQAKHKAVNTVLQSVFLPKQVYYGVKFATQFEQVMNYLDTTDQHFINKIMLPERNEVGAAKFNKIHLTRRCSYIESQYCQKNGGKIPYDLLASSLLESSTFSDENVAIGAKEYIETSVAIKPIPLQKRKHIYSDPDAAINPNGNFYFLTPMGATHLDIKYKEQMLMSFSHEVLRRQYAERIGKNPTDSEKPNYVTSYDEMASLKGLMESEMTWRLMDPAWYNEINKFSDTSLLREINTMLASMQLINHENMSSLERIELFAALEMLFIYEQIQGSQDKSPNSSSSKLKGNVQNIMQEVL